MYVNGVQILQFSIVMPVLMFFDWWGQAGLRKGGSFLSKIKDTLQMRRNVQAKIFWRRKLTKRNQLSIWSEVLWTCYSFGEPPNSHFYVDRFRTQRNLRRVELTVYVHVRHFSTISKSWLHKANTKSRIDVSYEVSKCYTMVTLTLEVSRKGARPALKLEAIRSALNYRHQSNAALTPIRETCKNCNCALPFAVVLGMDTVKFSWGGRGPDGTENWGLKDPS